MNHKRVAPPIMHKPDTLRANTATPTDYVHNAIYLAIQSFQDLEKAMLTLIEAVKFTVIQNV